MGKDSYSTQIHNIIEKWLKNRSLILNNNTLQEFSDRIIAIVDCGRIADENTLYRILSTFFMIKDLPFHREYIGDLSKELFQSIFRERNVELEAAYSN
jgi:hypothetical protein